MFGLLALLIAGSPTAQTAYPEKPIHLVVGFPPGSQPDTVARLLGQRLAESLGKPVVVEDVAGAAGNIAADRIAKAAPDGYTLGLLGAQIVTSPSLYKLAYDPVKDFAPVSQVTMSSFMLVVHNAVPAKNVKELVVLAKAQPGGLTFASSGSGSGTHMAAELFKSATALDIRHIPYKGVVAAIPDLLGGRVTMMFSPIANVLPVVREGKLRALAVTSLRRSSAVPELPTIAESGYPGFEVTVWYGLFAPARTPAAIVRKLNDATLAALNNPAVQEQMNKIGGALVAPDRRSPEYLGKFFESEIARWGTIIKTNGLMFD